MAGNVGIKKIYNLDAARTILAGMPELNIDEKNALEVAFPDPADFNIGAVVYQLRTRLQATKARVAHVLGADPRTLIRYFSALDMSVFCKVMIEDSFSKIANRRPDLPIEVPDGLPFKDRLALKTKMTLEMTLDAILNDPTKMYEADLESSGNFVKKMHEMYRLDAGKSTQNIETVFSAKKENQDKQEAAENEEMTGLGKAVNELRVIMVKKS